MRRFDQCVNVTASSDGASGVLFFHFPDGIVAVKSSSNNATELYGTLLARTLLFPAPRSGHRVDGW